MGGGGSPGEGGWFEADGAAEMLFCFFICDVIMLCYLMALLDGAFELYRFRESDDPFESNLLRLCSIRTDADV